MDTDYPRLRGRFIKKRKKQNSLPSEMKRKEEGRKKGGTGPDVRRA